MQRKQWSALSAVGVMFLCASLNAQQVRQTSAFHLDENESQSVEPETLNPSVNSRQHSSRVSSRKADGFQSASPPRFSQTSVASPASSVPGAFPSAQAVMLDPNRAMAARPDLVKPLSGQSPVGSPTDPGYGPGMSLSGNATADQSVLAQDPSGGAAYYVYPPNGGASVGCSGGCSGAAPQKFHVPHHFGGMSYQAAQPSSCGCNACAKASGGCQKSGNLMDHLFGDGWQSRWKKKHHGCGCCQSPMAGCCEMPTCGCAAPLLHGSSGWGAPVAPVGGSGLCCQGCGACDSCDVCDSCDACSPCGCDACGGGCSLWDKFLAGPTAWFGH